ncbi:MAG: hypothetical protein O2821_12915 [Chloroflexi bacterium]|nr:hypothetical protein [Chloroflexota bacterium]MDA1229038.1 hypothetical protein [Chloroflexota bacterium]
MDESPAPKLFVNEDVSKPENRLNVALFGLLNVPRFREWFISRFEVPEDSLFFPPQNVTANLRPDFVVTSPTKNMVHGWIEVELGSENTAQLSAYREHMKGKIISIAGREVSGCRQLTDCYLSLDEISARIVKLKPELDSQQLISAEVVTTLIDQKSGTSSSYAYIDPDSEIKNLPIMRMFEEHLGDILEFGTTPVPPGRVVITTGTQKGWTLRVFAREAASKSISLMWDQTLGAEVVRVPSVDHLRRYLPEAVGTISDFAQAIRELGFDAERVTGRESVPIAARKILAAMDTLAPIIRRLATGH